MAIHDTIDLDDPANPRGESTDDPPASPVARDERELALLRLLLACSDALAHPEAAAAVAHPHTDDR